MGLLAQARRTTPPETPNGVVLPLRKAAFAAMGTTCTIQFTAPGGDVQASRFERAAVGWVEAFEAKYSRFRGDSLVCRINAAAGKDWVAVDAEMEQLLLLCDTLHRMTRGILDPTALPLIELWNWKAPRPELPSEAEIESRRRLVGWGRVRREPGRVLLPEAGMALDFGGFGKEYAVDIVAQIAIEHGLPGALVDFGHDLRAVGQAPGRPAWHIGLEDPSRPGAAAGSVALSDRGIASSGDYLRSFTLNGKRYGHIIDPRTGRPVSNGCVQATVIAPTCLHAGVLSTTAFVLGVPAGIEFIEGFPQSEGIILTDRVRAQTRGFNQYVVAS